MKTRTHYSHSENFWRSRYCRVRDALADDESALNRFDSAVKDFDSFKGYWKLNGGRWERIVLSFRFPQKTEEDNVSDWR